MANSRIDAIKEAAAEAEVAAGPPQQRTPYLPGGHQSSPRAHQKVDMVRVSVVVAQLKGFGSVAVVKLTQARSQALS